jgi:hypothetical protein
LSFATLTINATTIAIIAIMMKVRTKNAPSISGAELPWRRLNADNRMRNAVQT